MTIMKYPVKKIMVDSGSSMDILFYSAFVKMNISSCLLKSIFTSLVGFIGDSIEVEGEITIPVMVGILPW